MDKLRSRKQRELKENKLIPLNLLIVVGKTERQTKIEAFLNWIR